MSSSADTAFTEAVDTVLSEWGEPFSAASTELTDALQELYHAELQFPPIWPEHRRRAFIAHHADIDAAELSTQFDDLIDTVTNEFGLAYGILPHPDDAAELITTARRQALEFGLGDSQQLAGQHRTLWRLGKRPRVFLPILPVARPLLAGPPKQRSVDGAAGERGDLGVKGAPLTHTARLGDVDHDREKPSAQRRSTLELRDGPDQRDPRFLDNFLGGLVAAYIPAGHPQHRGRVAIHQSGERRLVAGTQRRDQRRLVG